MSNSKEEVEKYLSTEYKGKSWRRMTNDDIMRCGDNELISQLSALSTIEGHGRRTATVLESIQWNESHPGEEPAEWSLNEVRSNEQFRLGHYGDIVITDEQIDEFVDAERSRIFEVVTGPPRSEKYIQAFMKKFPNKTEKDIRDGFELMRGGVATDDYAKMYVKQSSSHVASGSKRLTVDEIEQREEMYGVEDKTALAFADRDKFLELWSDVMKGSEVYQHAPDYVKENNEPIVKESDVTDEAFEPEEDMLHPITYVEQPIDYLLKEQRERLDRNASERGLPPKATV